MKILAATKYNIPYKKGLEKSYPLVNSSETSVETITIKKSSKQRLSKKFDNSSILNIIEKFLKRLI